MLTSALPSCADTVAEATPGTFASARSTAPEQEAQVIPFTSRRMISETPAARETPATAARKPTPSTAAMRSAGCKTKASNVTSAASWRRATDAEWTPGRELSGRGGGEREEEVRVFIFVVAVAVVVVFLLCRTKRRNQRFNSNSPERPFHRRGARGAVHALDRQLLICLLGCLGEGAKVRRKAQRGAFPGFGACRRRLRQTSSPFPPHLCLRSAAPRSLFPSREQAKQLCRHFLVVGVVLRLAGPAPGHIFCFGVDRLLMFFFSFRICFECFSFSSS